MSLIEGFADTSKYEKKNTSLDKLWKLPIISIIMFFSL